MEQTDRGQFDRALAKLVMTTNGTARLSPTVATTYWNVLRQYPVQAVMAGMTEAVSSSSGHVSPAALARLCQPDVDQVKAEAREVRSHELGVRMHQADQRAEEIGLRRFGEILWRDPEFQAMKRKAAPAYAFKVGGLAPPDPEPGLDPAKFYTYRGGFDYLAVVAATPRPRSGQDVAAWETFWKVLREEYESFIGGS